jgi:nucleotide-binding universal stress UspA family protein
MYEAILVATDGSDTSTAAVEQAVELAAEGGGTVHFLSVVDVGTEMSASAVGDIADDLAESLETVATDALDAAVERAEDAGISYERTVLEGFPHEAITAYSTDNDIDLVVVGASGRSGITTRLLGSTTDRVVRSAEVSVLVARP